MLCITKFPFSGLYLVGHNCTKALHREVRVGISLYNTLTNNQGTCALHYTGIQLYWIFLCSNAT